MTRGMTRARHGEMACEGFAGRCRALDTAPSTLPLQQRGDLHTPRSITLLQPAGAVLLSSTP